MPKVQLWIVFNHRYEGNLPKLRKMYGKRFPSLNFLMPFPRESNTDVVPVFANSYFFHSFFATAWERGEKDPGDYFVFAGDDFILNPALDDENLTDSLQLGPDQAFISEILPITRASPYWWRLRTVARDIKHASSGFNWKDELPTVETAIAIFEKHGLPTDQLRWSPSHGYTGILPLGRGIGQSIKTRLLMNYLGPKFPYPLAWGYSDFIIVPRSAMARFAHYCKTFAAMGIFVESAAATCLALAAESIKTEAQTSWRSTIAWDPHTAALAKSVGPNLDTLYSSFKPGELAKHPVKLSRIDF